MTLITIARIKNQSHLFIQYKNLITLLNMKKKCNTCGITKPHFDFHKRTANTDGYDNKCKECRKALIFTPQGLEDADEENRKGAEKILTALGFELYNPENPVYIQFNRRIYLKYGKILGDIKKGS
jgi:hypothetical protein